MMLRPHASMVLCLLLAWACGTPPAPADDAALPPPVDAGPPDAGPPPCLRPVEPGEPFGDLLRECGVCLEPHARYVNPYGIGPGRDTYAAAVPGGVVLLMGWSTVLVTEAGEVIPNFDYPYVEEPDPTLYTRLVQLSVAAERGRVWVTSHMLRAFDPSVGATHAVLYEVDESGWRRVASHRVDTYLYPVFATADGDLMSEAPVDGRPALLRLRARDDGGVDELRRRVTELGLPDVLWGRITHGWPLPDGDAALVWHVQDSFTRTDYLVGVTSELELLRPVEEIGGPPGSPRYELYSEPFVYAASQRRDGSITLALAGALTGMDAARDAHHWLLRVAPDGSLLDAPPGVWLNFDMFLSESEARIYWHASNPILFPGGVVGHVWNVNYSGRRVYDAGEILDRDGTRLFVPPLLFDTVTDYSWTRWVHDGNDRPYIGVAGFRYPDTRLDRSYSVTTLNTELDEDWHVYVQGCEERTGEYNITTAGAWDDGVWVVWADELRDVNGHRFFITKATLIRSDGSFAWTE